MEVETAPRPVGARNNEAVTSTVQDDVTDRDRRAWRHTPSAQANCEQSILKTMHRGQRSFPGRVFNQAPILLQNYTIRTTPASSLMNDKKHQEPAKIQRENLARGERTSKAQVTQQPSSWHTRVPTASGRQQRTGRGDE